MPRDGAGVYTKPNPDVVADTTIESAKYNTNVADVEADLNLPRPIVAGGTAATSADNALTSLSAEKAKQIVTNWDSTTWRAGSFYAATSASGAAPVAGHAFAGIAYYANATDFVNEAIDLTDSPTKYIRMMTAGVWGAWTNFGVVRYDKAQTLTTTQKAQARVNIATPLRGWIAGLTLSTAGSSATFGVAAGEAADSTVSDLMQLAGAVTKTTAAWAVGTGVGALDTGAIAAVAWYHVFLIKRPDTGVIDILVSLSATAPTLPANYTLFRRIGSLLTAASQWVAFSQNGDEFLWSTVVLSVNGFTGATTTQTATLSVPTGVKMTALLNVLANGNDSRAVIFPFDKTDEAVAVGVMNFGTSIASTGQFGGTMQVRTNTSGQIRFKLVIAATLMYIGTAGWIDRRGRDD